MTTQSSRQSIPTLLTFAPMIDSELSRLVLAHHNVAYTESDHLFGWVSVLTFLHGGYGQIPILYGSGATLTGPRAIAEHYDQAAPTDRRLIPPAGPALTQMEAGWTRYNGEMGSDTAVIAYYHLLPQRDLLIKVFSRAISATEARLLPYVYGALRQLFTVLLQLKPAHVETALQRVRANFATTDALLAHGSPFLDGDRLTLADLALVAAAAPLIMPDNYGVFLPSYDEMPPALTAIIDSLRQTRTADYVRRFYAGRPTA